jgi:hypothetical protein
MVMAILGMRRMVCGIGAMVVAVAAVTAVQVDRYEKRIPFKLDQSLDVSGTVGPVKFSNLRVNNLGRGYGKGSRASELSTTLRLAFDVNNPGEDWVITYTIEFLDRNGNPIDRFTRKEGYEEEAKVSNFEHPILEYVLPQIAEVRVMITGRED